MLDGRDGLHRRLLGAQDHGRSEKGGRQQEHGGDAFRHEASF
jgi:hypothetical protein